MGRNRKIQPFHALINEGYEKTIQVWRGGRAKSQSKLGVIVLQQVLRAIEGDKGAIRFVIETLNETEGVKRKRVIIEWSLDGKRHREYFDNLVRITDESDGSVHWIRRERGREDVPVPAPSKKRVKAWEDDDGSSE